jgi:endonuclease III related protein
MYTARVVRTAESETPPWRNEPLAQVRVSSTPQSGDVPELQLYYDALFGVFGPQHWWPARTAFEVVVGAILTQNTSWKNVEPAIANLRTARILTATGIERVSEQRLASLIRPSGYYRQKARTLKEFSRYLREAHGGSLAKMLQTPTVELREELLAVRGIGPETADCVLLYAAGRAVFVIDAYTRRILERHGIAHSKQTYEELRRLFERNLSPDAQLFNEYHALIVQVGKQFCRPRDPLCGHCPLNAFLPITMSESSPR